MSYEKGESVLHVNSPLDCVRLWRKGGRGEDRWNPHGCMIIFWVAFL